MKINNLKTLLLRLTIRNQYDFEDSFNHLCKHAEENYFLYLNLINNRFTYNVLSRLLLEWLQSEENTLITKFQNDTRKLGIDEEIKSIENMINNSNNLLLNSKSNSEKIDVAPNKTKPITSGHSGHRDDYINTNPNKNQTIAIEDYIGKSRISKGNII